MDSLEKTLGEWFGKLPALPESVRRFLVVVAPWLALISVVLSIPMLLVLFGFSTAVMGWGGMYGVTGSMPMMVIAVASVVLTALAVPGLFARTYVGWKFMFYGTLVQLLGNLIAFDLASLIIGALVCFYLLFQVRSRYQ